MRKLNGIGNFSLSPVQSPSLWSDSHTPSTLLFLCLGTYFFISLLDSIIFNSFHSLGNDALKFLVYSPPTISFLLFIPGTM